MYDAGDSSVAQEQQDVVAVACLSTSQLNAHEQDQVDPEHNNVALSKEEAQYLQEFVYIDGNRVENQKRTGDKIRRLGFALVVFMLMSIWSLAKSKFLSSYKVSPSLRVSSVARGILQGQHSSYDDKYVDLSNEKNKLGTIILQRQEEERRFHRDEEARRRERLGKSRHAMMKAQEDKRRELEEQMRVIEEKRIKILQRQAEEKLLRDEEIGLRKERLGEERIARIDAFEKRKARKEEIWEEERILRQKDGALDIEISGVEDASHRDYHVMRKAKLYTFLY